MELLTFWKTMRIADRKAFAEACGSTFAHVRNVAYKQKPCSPSLAVNIERESRRQVPAESLCPDFDWAYLRGSSSVSHVQQSEVA